MDKEEKEKLWAELEAQGEDSTQEKLGLGLYGDRRRGGVEEWLRQEEHKRTSRHDTQWHKTWWGQAIIAILIIVLAAALITFFAL